MEATYKARSHGVFTEADIHAADSRPVAPRCARHESNKAGKYKRRTKSGPLVFARLVRFIRPAEGRRATGPPCVLRVSVSPCLRCGFSPRAPVAPLSDFVISAISNLK